MASKDTFFYILIFLFVFLIAFHIISVIFSLYWLIRWIDIPLHFFGGVWLAMFSIWIFYISGKFSLSKKPYILSFILTLGLVALGGILWEFFEFSFDFVSHKKWLAQLGLSDTISDLFFDLLGGSCAYFIFINKSKNG
ncbi:MAG: hypothetical protein AAB491_00015 [Patescibacteria group bacterium]